MGTREAYLFLLLALSVDRQIIVGYSLMQTASLSLRRIVVKNNDCQAFYYNLERKSHRGDSLNAERSSDNLSTIANDYHKDKKNLSEIDSRVLQSILQDTKLDLKTEEGVRKLLERGYDKVAQKKSIEINEESDYSSTILKTLSDTKLWKSLKAKSTKALESVGIWVVNKVEQDVKLLTALALFAWDRAVLDVSRALPEARDQIQRNKVLLLTNSSSFEDELVQSTSLKLELSRPLDEFKIVSRDFLGILSGQRISATGSGGRGLRTAAPAGSFNAAERQRRAFLQRQKINQQAKDMSRIAGSVVDSAWELNREITAERNTPGYKTEPIRMAISAAAVGTGNLLRQAAVEARLAAATRKKLRSLNQSPNAMVEKTDAGQEAKASSSNAIKKESQELQPLSTDSFSTATSQDVKNKIDQLLNQIQYEIDDLADRLNKCIQKPGETWLQGYADDSPSSKSELREVVTKMITIRNLVEAASSQPFTLLNVEKYLERLAIITRHMEEFFKSAPSPVGANLRCILINRLSADSEMAREVAYKLDALSSELYQTMNTLQGKRIRGASSSALNDEAESFNTSFFAQRTTVDLDNVAVERPAPKLPENFLVELEPDFQKHTLVNSNEELWSYDAQVMVNIGDDRNYDNTVYDIETNGNSIEIPRQPNAALQPEENDENFRRVVAEIIEDTEASASIFEMKQVKILSDSEIKNEQESAENVLAKAALRSIDVLFFVLERLITVGLPATVSVVSTVAKRLECVRSEGKGSEGWQTYDKLSKNIRGKY